jgi:hypothetical protein
MVDVARALSGIGAAFKNEIPQFQQRIQQEDLYKMKMADMDMARQDADAKREEARKKTFFQDVAVAKQYFDKGDFGSIADIARDRLNILTPMGVNTRDSQQMLQLADAARAGDTSAIQQLKNQLDTVYSVGQLYGVIPKPAERKGVVVGDNLIDPVTGKEIYKGTSEDKTFEKESGLRKEFNALDTVKNFAIISGGLGKVLTSAKDPSGAGDISLLFAYMKMLDPNSVVREGEFATAQNAGSVPESLMARYNKVINGELLSDEIRNDFVDRAQRLYQNEAETFGRTYDKYKNIASSNKLDPTRALIDYRYNPASPEVLNIPRSAVDQGITADVWGAMNPEEQALFN